MNDTVEKSCWGITLWAVGIALVLGFLFVALGGADTATTIAAVQSK